MAQLIIGLESGYVYREEIELLIIVKFKIMDKIPDFMKMRKAVLLKSHFIHLR